MRTLTGNIVTPNGVLTGGAVMVDDNGEIAEVGPSRTSPSRAEDLDATGLWVLPGFVDIHVHGGGGADFMHGTAEAVRQVTRTHAQFGTTGLLATTLTASREATNRAIAAAREVWDAGPGAGEARVLGVHLEGPYICPARRGAQPEAFVRLPDAEEFRHWVEMGGGAIKKVTLAPEMLGAEVVVREAAQAGVTVSVGHTDADAETVERAIAWGATGATHVFNAMRGLSHREPGAAGACLARREIVCEVIADGVHLHPLVVRLILAAKGPEGAVLVTDAIEGTAMPDGVYHLGGQAVTVREGTAAFADGTLAGSVLTMNRAFFNALAFAEISVTHAARLSSGNAARQLGLAGTLGEIAVGKAADLVALHPDTGAVEWTLVGGQVAWRR